MEFIRYKARKEAYVLKEKIRTVDKFLYDMMQKYNCYIAGGAIVSIFTGKKINDYDIYFPSYNKEDGFNNDLKQFEDELKLIKGCKRIGVTDFATTYRINNNIIQIISIYKDSESIEEIMAKFDYECCMGAFSFKDNDEFVLGKHFLHHNANKKLMFNIETEFPFASFIRMKKYIEKGYDISGIDMLKIILACNNIVINTYADIRKHILGIDTLMLRDLTDKMLNDSMAEKTFDFNEMVELIEIYVDKYFGWGEIQDEETFENEKEEDELPIKLIDTFVVKDSKNLTE